MTELRAQERVLELELEVRRLQAQLDQVAAVPVREALLVEAERIAHLGSWTWELATNQVYWSDELFRILGRDPATQAPTPEAFFGSIHPADMARVMRLAQDSLNSGRVERIEFRVQRGEGPPREIVMDGAFIFDSAGNISRMVGCCLDVTERRRNESEARRSRMMLEMSERLSGVGVFYFEPGRAGSQAEILWSPEMHRIFDTAEPLDAVAFSLAVLPEDRASVDAMQAEVYRTGRAGPVSFRFRRPDGEVRHALMNAQVLGALGAVGGSIVDITERIHLETQLRATQKMEALGRLAGGVAHDFNNLLTVIVGNASMLLEEAPDNEWGVEVLSAAEQAGLLTTQLLSFSRDSVIRQESVHLNLVAHSALRLIKRVIGEDVQVVLVQGPELWPILADAGQVNQVLMNLAINARDALPEGGQITIETRNVRLPAQNPDGTPTDCVELRVLDNGIGMSESDKFRVFEPFYTTKGQGGGTGLGLSIVFSIVKQHGGTIEVESEPGRGSEFRMRWPKFDAVEDARRVSPLSAAPRLRAARATILVVEDEVAVMRVVRSTLEGAGYTILTAGSVAAAEAIGASQIDLLLTDIALPDGNGVELVDRLRATAPLLRVLHMTGYAADTGGILEGSLLPKPFAPKQLLDKVAEILCCTHPEQGRLGSSSAGT